MTDFNPADHKVDEVKAHVQENPQDLQAVLEAEKARGDDARSSLVSHLENLKEVTPEAPVAAEGKAVTVEPNPTPTTQSNTLLGKEYEVTPERGYRVKG